MNVVRVRMYLQDTVSQLPLQHEETIVEIKISKPQTNTEKFSKKTSGRGTLNHYLKERHYEKEKRTLNHHFAERRYRKDLL